MSRIVRHIPKGTLVHIRTTNGGDITSRLLKNYRPSHDVVVASGDHYLIIGRDRVRSIDTVK